MAALRPFVILEMEEESEEEEMYGSGEDSEENEASSETDCSVENFNTSSNVQRIFPRRNSCYAHIGLYDQEKIRNNNRTIFI